MSDIKSRLAKKLNPSDLEERCGFVMKRGSIKEVKNIAATPVNAFHMDPKAVVQHIEKGAVATWHTHPGGSSNLSQDDFLGFMQWPDLTHYVVGVDGVRAYVVKEGAVIQL